MCNNKECPLKETCLRYKGEPDKISQLYSDFKYENGNCDYYYEIKENTPLTNKAEMKQFMEKVIPELFPNLKVT